MNDKSATENGKAEEDCKLKGDTGSRSENIRSGHNDPDESHRTTLLDDVRKLSEEATGHICVELWAGRRRRWGRDVAMVHIAGKNLHEHVHLEFRGNRNGSRGRVDLLADEARRVAAVMLELVEKVKEHPEKIEQLEVSLSTGGDIKSIVLGNAQDELAWLSFKGKRHGSRGESKMSVGELREVASALLERADAVEPKQTQEPPGSHAL